MTTQTHEIDSPGVTFMPPAVFYLCLIGGGLVEFVLGSDIPGHWAMHLAAGLLIGGTGFWFMMWAHGLFEKVGTAVKTKLPCTVLVMEGAYLYSRNPMYVGMIGFVFGIGIAVGSVWMVCIGLILPLYLALHVVPREEAYLARRWGNDYLAYRARVRRWL